MTDESALLVAVPAAEPAVARHRSRLDTSAAVGVPAHITVLYPFLPPDLIDADTLATLARLFASVPGFRFTLDQHLPIETEATSVTLMTGPPPGSAPTAARWKTVATFSLAAPTITGSRPVPPAGGPDPSATAPCP